MVIGGHHDQGPVQIEPLIMVKSAQVVSVEAYAETRH